MNKKIPCIKCSQKLWEHLKSHLEKWHYIIEDIGSFNKYHLLIINRYGTIGICTNIDLGAAELCNRELVTDPEEFLAKAAKLKGFEYKPNNNNSKPMSNILERANQIVNHRAEEKDRQYGPFSESIERAAKMYNLMSSPDEQITPEGVFKVLVALKLSRETYNHKEDNLLDAVAYLGALNNYREQQNNLVNETTVWKRF